MLMELHEGREGGLLANDAHVTVSSHPCCQGLEIILANAKGTTSHQMRDHPSGFNSPPCVRPYGKPFRLERGRDPETVSLLLSPRQNTLR